MRESFDKALAFVLRWEGGKSDHPSDRGGRTNKGITQAVFDDWCLTNRRAKSDVFGISDADVTSIYRDRYWRAAGCDRLPVPLDLVVFDAAVNCGVGQSIRFLQRSVGAPVDGRMGPVTLARVDDRGLAPPQIAEDCINRRDAFYRRLVEMDSKQGVFLQGWLNRTAALRKEISNGLA